MQSLNSPAALAQVEADKDAHTKIGSVREMYAFVVALAVARLDLELQAGARVRVVMLAAEHLRFWFRRAGRALRLQGHDRWLPVPAPPRLPACLQAPPESPLMIQPPVQDSVGAASQVRGKRGLATYGGWPAGWCRVACAGLPGAAPSQASGDQLPAAPLPAPSCPGAPAPTNDAATLHVGQPAGLAQRHRCLAVQQAKIHEPRAAGHGAHACRGCRDEGRANAALLSRGGCQRCRRMQPGGHALPQPHCTATPALTARRCPRSRCRRRTRRAGLHPRQPRPRAAPPLAPCTTSSACWWRRSTQASRRWAARTGARCSTAAESTPGSSAARHPSAVTTGCLQPLPALT